MADIDVDKLVGDIKSAASGILKTDVAALRGFSERQVTAIAQQAKLVAAGIANGDITEATREFFLDSLEDLALNFARTLRGLMTVTIEKVWNAVVAVLWKAISTATGLVIPAPMGHL
jgi:hypothetical protein